MNSHLFFPKKRLIDTEYKIILYNKIYELVEIHKIVTFLNENYK